MIHNLRNAKNWRKVKWDVSTMGTLSKISMKIQLDASYLKPVWKGFVRDKDLSLYSNKTIFHFFMCKTQRSRMHTTDTAATPNGHLIFVAACNRSIYEVIQQYDSCNTGELDRHAQHQQPCLASRTPRVIARQEQPVLSGTHWSSFAHRQMSVVLCLRRFPMKIENCHIWHQRPLKVHQRPPR